MKKLIQITLALIMALSFVGCSKDSGKTDGPVEVTLWHTYTEHHNDFINQMIDNIKDTKIQIIIIVKQIPAIIFICLNFLFLIFSSMPVV